MKSTILYTAVILLCVLNLNAQNSNLMDSNDQLATRGWLVSSFASEKSTNIEGSPFVIDEFMAIELTHFEGRHFKGRYNAFNGDMEVKDQLDDRVFVLDKSISNYVVRFVGLDKEYRSYKYISEQGYIESDFFVVLGEYENIALLQREQVIFLDEKVPNNSYESGRPASYKRVKDRFYIQLKGSNAQVLPTKRKAVAKIFPDHSKKVLAFMKENKTSLSNVEEVTELVIFLNTL